MKNPDHYPESVRKLEQLGKQIDKDKKRAIRKTKQWKFDTIAVHGLYSVKEAIEKNQGSIVEPLYLSTSQAFQNADEMEAALAYLYPGWIYSRIANPTVGYLEDTLTLLETYDSNIEAGSIATSSGMSAIFQALQPFLERHNSDEMINFVSSCHVYGGTFQQFSIRKEKEQDIQVRWVSDPTNLDQWAENIDNHTRFLYGEVPSNPSLTFFDIEAVANLAHEHELPLIIDSTIASPALLRPLCHHADIVIHSLSKSMTSSGFCIGGAIIAKKKIVTNIENDELKEDVPRYLKLQPFRDFGPSISPFNALMTLNDLRTLRSRMKCLSETTQKVAEFLNFHPMIKKVNYLGLKNHPLHDLTKRYMILVDSEYDFGKPLHLYGHLLSFEVKGNPQNTRDFFDRLQLIFRATDLGRIKSVATIPAISTHQQQGEEARIMASISPNDVRLCIGGEHPDDIISDLDRALKSLKKNSRVFINRSTSQNGEAAGKKDKSRTQKIRELKQRG